MANNQVNDPYGNTSIKLLDDATGTSAAPSAATDGKPMRPGCNDIDLLLVGSAAGGTLEITIRLWGYNPTQAAWFPLSGGSGAGNTANTSGWMNGGAKIETIGTLVINHYEPVTNLELFTRLYAQVVAISGTTPTFDLDAHFHTSHSGRR